MRRRRSHFSTGRFILRVNVLLFVCSNIVLAERFDSLLRLPRSGSIPSRRKSKLVLSVDDHGARGDGISDDTAAIGHVWKSACSLSAPARVLLSPKKTYLFHSIDFAGPCRSKITLEIAGNIVAPKDPEAWEGLNPHRWIYFHGVKHLTLEGGGKINGMGREWWHRSCKTNATNPCHPAPTAVIFHRCKDLIVRNLSVINSQQMHVAFTNCLRVKVSNLRVIAPAASPNTDGIHISASRGVQIKDCIIRTGDDCISIVSNSSRITVRDIICGPGHGISIGSLGKSKSWAEVHDVVVDGALVSNTENGLRIKTWQGGGGSVTNVIFQDVWMENVAHPIIIDQYYCDSFQPCPNQTSAVKVGNISFLGIKGTSATEKAMIFSCSDDTPCEGLYLEDIHLFSHAGGTTRSFCWQAYGSISGLVYPPPCFSSEDEDNFIKQETQSGSEDVHSF
ncbi:hypothetical protein BT93_J2062 [Corymbia citriodora subsp. variegata]|nr:hypothetical protein BT93_J2062 [Corymbia citriodora subsp. variegata]